MSNSRVSYYILFHDTGVRALFVILLYYCYYYVTQRQINTAREALGINQVSNR